MLHFKTPQEEVWRGAGAPTGSFGWRTASATAFIPAGATAGTINLGLQSSSGTVWVRSVKITASEPAATVPEGFRAVYTDRVKRMPRLRGIMSPNSFKPEDMDELKRWNANLIRWQIKRNWGRAGTELDLEEYLRWFNGRLEELDKVLDKCGELGIYVLIDLHTPPGAAAKPATWSCSTIPSTATRSMRCGNRWRSGTRTTPPSGAAIFSTNRSRPGRRKTTI